MCRVSSLAGVTDFGADDCNWSFMMMHSGKKKNDVPFFPVAYKIDIVRYLLLGVWRLGDFPSRTCRYHLSSKIMILFSLNTVTPALATEFLREDN